MSSKSASQIDFDSLIIFQNKKEFMSMKREYRNRRKRILFEVEQQKLQRAENKRRQLIRAISYDSCKYKSKNHLILMPNTMSTDKKKGCIEDSKNYSKIKQKASSWKKPSKKKKATKSRKHKASAHESNQLW